MIEFFLFDIGNDYLYSVVCISVIITTIDITSLVWCHRYLPGSYDCAIRYYSTGWRQIDSGLSYLCETISRHCCQTQRGRSSRTQPLFCRYVSHWTTMIYFIALHEYIFIQGRNCGFICLWRFVQHDEYKFTSIVGQSHWSDIHVTCTYFWMWNE